MNEEHYESYIFYCVYCGHQAMWDAAQRRAIYSCKCNTRQFKIHSPIQRTEVPKAFYDAFKDGEEHNG